MQSCKNTLQKPQKNNLSRALTLFTTIRVVITRKKKDVVSSTSEIVVIWQWKLKEMNQKKNNQILIPLLIHENKFLLKSPAETNQRANGRTWALVYSCHLKNKGHYGIQTEFVYFKADIPVGKRVLCTFDTVCDACAKSFATYDGFNQQWMSSYLISTPRHVLDDGSTRSSGPVLTCFPQHEWRCPPPCCKSWRWLDESQVYPHNGFQITYGAYCAYLIDI